MVVVDRLMALILEEMEAKEEEDEVELVVLQVLVQVLLIIITTMQLVLHQGMVVMDQQILVGEVERLLILHKVQQEVMGGLV